jgi:2-methylcitrate dehydratase PrpD
MQRDVAHDVVAHAVKATFSDLPESTVKISKKFILDTLGVAIAGSAAPGCGEVASYIKEIGGKPESTVIMFGHKVPNFHAAFVNGMMCHALDFDDTHEGALVHANVTILPAALATAESVGGISGKDFFLAYALGVDFACRLWERSYQFQDFGPQRKRNAQCPGHCLQSGRGNLSSYFGYCPR